VVELRGWALFEEAPLARVEAWLGNLHLGRARLGRELVLSRHDLGTYAKQIGDLID
jgi:hypothetical protein